MPLVLSNPGLIVAGAFVLLGNVAVGLKAQNSAFAVPQAQAAAVSQANEQITRLNIKLRRTKSISDEDLATLVAFAGDQKQLPMVRGLALKPLTWLKSDKLSGTQLAKLDQLIFSILQEDDKASDPDGYMKMQAASVAARVVRGKRFLGALQPLTSDRRDWVRTAAQQSYDSIKKDFGQ